MPISATAKSIGISATKLGRILDMVRGKSVDEALQMLEFVSSTAATRVAKVVRSASANAENELVARSSDLEIVEAYANEAKPAKRMRARARGRFARIIRPSSHLTIVVDEKEL
jgi:large subunit ribosomal protein L22